MAFKPARLEESSRRVSRMCAAATAAVGAVVLAGWAFRFPPLTRLAPGFAPMAANTAFALLLTGIALWPLAARDPPARGRAVPLSLGLVVASIGALTLVEYVTQKNLGIDEMLVRDTHRVVETAAAGRMTPATAVALSLLGLAASLMGAKRALRARQGLCLLASGIALLAFAGYLHDAPSLYAVGAYSGIAIQTVLAIFIAAFGFLAADPGHGITAIFTSDTVGGVMVRRVLPWSIAILVGLGGLEHVGSRSGLYQREFGESLLLVTSIVLIAAVIVWQGAALGRIDRDRLEATGAASHALEMVRELSRAVEQSPASVVITDPKGDIEYVNPKFTEVTGFGADEVIGMNPRILKSGELPPEVYRELWETITAGREWHGEFHNRKKNGEGFWEHASISPIFDEGRRITHFVSVMEDITERRRAAETLAEKEHHFRSLIENAQDIITIIDTNGTIVFQSPAAEKLLGRRPEEFVGKNAFAFIHPDDVAEAQAAIRHAVEGREAPKTWPFRLQHANGSWRTMEGIGKLLPGGEIPQIVVNSRDVTETRARAEQLRQSQKMEAVGRLAGGIAHDFNNLLTVITGYVELAALRLKPEDPMRLELSEIDTAARRAADLTRQLLAFSRQQVLRPSVINLNTVVSDTDKMLRRVIGEDIELVTRLSEHLGAVKADTGQIVQVLLNLAVNARDAMPKGGTLTIETSGTELDESYSAFHFFDVSPGPYVRLDVSDTGSGMDAKTLSHIFEPFFTTKEVGKGTGLGLATVYGIVKQSGGHVTVYSEPGLGTTFKIYLPGVDDLSKSATQSSPHARETGGTETILVVEDDEAVRKLTCRSLEAKGYTTLPAANAGEALLLCQEHPAEIHLMITDVVMPHVSGRELAQRVTALRPRMKLLFMSGYTDDAILHHGVLDAGTPFLQKPFTPRSLVQKVRDVLDAGE